MSRSTAYSHHTQGTSEPCSGCELILHNSLDENRLLETPHAAPGGERTSCGGCGWATVASLCMATRTLCSTGRFYGDIFAASPIDSERHPALWKSGHGFLWLEKTLFLCTDFPVTAGSPRDDHRISRGRDMDTFWQGFISARTGPCKPPKLDFWSNTCMQQNPM